MTRWTDRAIEVEAHAAMGRSEHARAVIAHELEQAWRAGMERAAEIAVERTAEVVQLGRWPDRRPTEIAAAIRAEAAQ